MTYDEFFSECSKLGVTSADIVTGLLKRELSDLREENAKLQAGLSGIKDIIEYVDHRAMFGAVVTPHYK